MTTCLGNLEMSGNLTAVREMLEFTKNQGIVREKILSGKSCLKLFIVNCIFASIQVFSRSLFWRSAANRQGNVGEIHIVWRVVSLRMTSVCNPKSFKSSVSFLY